MSRKYIEYIETFDREGNYLGDEDRETFYQQCKEEFKKTGKVSRQIKSIRLLLQNRDGSIYLQKRSKTKGQNAGLYDKTIGGHVYKGHSFDITVTKECAEELGFPAAVLSEKDFKKAIKNTDISVVGLFREVGVENAYESLRVNNNGSIFIQPFLTAFYIGYFNGPIRFIDGECSGIEAFSIEELETELKTNPAKFTNDLRYMFDKYRKYLKPLTPQKKQPSKD